MPANWCNPVIARRFFKGYPGVDFRQIPRDFGRANREVGGKLSALLHVVNCTSAQRYLLEKLVPVDQHASRNKQIGIGKGARFHGCLVSLDV